MSSFESTRPKSKAVDRVHRYLADRAERIASEGRQELLWFPPQVLDDPHANDQEEVDDKCVLFSCPLDLDSYSIHSFPLASSCLK